MRHRLVRSIAAVGILAACAAQAAAADDYPTRPIRVITNTSAGGLSDIFARSAGEQIRQRWGQPLIVENRPGGSQNTGVRACADATPDGYTICILNADPMVYNQFLFKSLPFDPEKSVVPVTNLYHLIQTLVVNANLNVKTVDELIALSKAKPGTLSYLTASPPLALYMERLKSEKGADWVRVPFKGGGDAVNAIMNGSTPIGLIGVGNVSGQLTAGTMTALAMLNNIRSPQFPDVPTLEQTGYHGPASQSWYGLFVPPGTPQPIIDKLAAAFAEIVNAPEFVARNLTGRGLVSAINTPEKFSAAIKQERIVAAQVV
ncbi:MAG TPA: tripartite tricarboxylate transporter substrate binding protein, partial [Xanthobacteraceae bacterium]